MPYTKVIKEGEYYEKIVYYKDKKCTMRHREDGPAVEWKNGNKEWWANGVRHREDGPAVEWCDGGKDFYLNGSFYVEKRYWEIIAKIRLGGFV